MRDENINRTIDANADRSHLHLVDRSAEQKKASRISEPATSELRELIAEVHRGTPRKKKIEDDLLPPAA